MTYDIHFNSMNPATGTPDAPTGRQAPEPPPTETDERGDWGRTTRMNSGPTDAPYQWQADGAA